MFIKITQLLLLLSSINSLTDITNALPNIFHRNVSSSAGVCRNPNGNSGSCVSIEQCESLRAVLINEIACYYKFLRLSQCDCDLESSGSSPCVCCTSENHFTKEARAHRVVFPDTDEHCNDSVDVTKVDRVATQPQKFPKPPNCGAITIATKIYGGEEAELTEFSWMVNLEYITHYGQLVSVCAGSLINARYVLTAAHCVVGKIEEKVGKVVSIRLGEHNTATDIDCNSENYCTSPTQRVGYESIIVHPNYRAERYRSIHQHNDIALIRMNQSVVFSDSIQPVCLPSVETKSQLTAGTKLTVAGWGHNGTLLATHEKRKVKIPYVELEECRKFYSKKILVADEQLCAGGIYREDTCSGDSGGPLMRLDRGTWIIEGIVSFGSGCGLEKPGIYTNVSSYLDWIEEMVVL